MDVLLQMNSIDKYFNGVKALDGVCLEVYKGEVHALLGANGAGKSTLMKILVGEIGFDSGTVIFDGETLSAGSKRKQSGFGISLVHQEISVVPVLTVAQYMFLGRENSKCGIVSDSQLESEAVRYLEKIGAHISPSEMMGSLSVSQQQLVEIAKALTHNIKLLIMDEPTTALGDKETDALFEVIKELKASGVSVIYISHRLEEIGRIADRITILKDGRHVKTMDGRITDKNELIRLLAGRDIISTKKETNEKLKDAPVVLDVRHLETSSLLSDVCFTLRKGEVLGFAGLMGSGRTLISKAICGLVPTTGGEVFIDGKKVDITSPKKAAECGICYLSEDRNKDGMIQSRSIIANSVISSLDNYEKGLVLDDEKMLNDAVEYNRKMKTKYSDPHAPINSLSGGNCQKVIIAKWLIRNLPIMIFDEPTKGIDIGAKDEIYQIIRDIVSKGNSVILISSETDELMQNCDRIIVMCEGRVSGEMNISDATPEKIVKYAMGGKNE